MNKITINGVELELTQEQVESLKKTLEEKDEGRWKPIKNDNYISVDECGLISTIDYFDETNDFDKWNIDSGNCFRTEYEAEMHKLRVQSMAERKWAKADYWYFDFFEDKVYNFYNNTSPPQKETTFFIGNMHSTRAEAEAWGKKYAEAWKILLPNNENK
jgi:hypothetical protein